MPRFVVHVVPVYLYFWTGRGDVKIEIGVPFLPFKGYPRCDVDIFGLRPIVLYGRWLAGVEKQLASTAGVYFAEKVRYHTIPCHAMLCCTIPLSYHHHAVIIPYHALPATPMVLWLTSNTAKIGAKDL